jgi:hypothetical protein
MLEKAILASAVPLLVIAIFMVLGLPLVYKLAKVTRTYNC